MIRFSGYFAIFAFESVLDSKGLLTPVREFPPTAGLFESEINLIEKGIKDKWKKLSVFTLQPPHLSSWSIPLLVTSSNSKNYGRFVGSVEVSRNKIGGWDNTLEINGNPHTVIREKFNFKRLTCACGPTKTRTKAS